MSFLEELPALLKLITSITKLYTSVIPVLTAFYSQQADKSETQDL